MMKMKLAYSVLAMAAAMILTSCSEDSQPDLVCLAPSSVTGTMIIETRADAYTADYDPSDGATMGVFWTSQAPEASACNGQGTFSYDSDAWDTDVRIKKATYDFFIYSPKNDGATFNATNKELTLPSMSVSTHDVLVTDGLNGKGEGVSVGNYTYTLSADKKDFAAGQIPTDYIDLKMSHLFAKFTIKIAIDPEYAAMRSVHISKVELGSDKSATATVTFGNTGASVEWSDWQTNDEIDWAEAPSASGLDLTEDYQTFGSAYMLPEVLSNEQNLSLRITYDVFDTAGKKIRTDNVAENTLKTDDVTLQSGKNYIKQVLIQPSYLYCLSDNDEPTLTF